MLLPDELDIENALIFFHAYMYGPLRGKMRLYRARDMSPRMVMSGIGGRAPCGAAVRASVLTQAQSPPGGSPRGNVVACGRDAHRR